MIHHRNKTRKHKKNLTIPPTLAEGGINLLELLVEAGGGRKTRRRRKILKRR